jgi:hypothetical protein
MLRDETLVRVRPLCDRSDGKKYKVVMRAEAQEIEPKSSACCMRRERPKCVSSFCKNARMRKAHCEGMCLLAMVWKNRSTVGSVSDPNFC